MAFSRSVVPAIYQEMKQKVEVKLTEMLSKLALPTDMWTSAANDVYLGLNCHYLTANFEMVSQLSTFQAHRCKYCYLFKISS